MLLAIAAVTAPAEDGPRVGEIVAVCRAALAADWQGVEAAACAWYLEPCAVCGIDTPPATWCVPADVTAAARATRVLDELARRAQDAAASSAPLIREILTTSFPCAGGGEAR